MRMLNHPLKLWILSIMYACFMIGFGALLSGLIFLSHDELGLSINNAVNFFATFTSLAFTLTLIGGWVCDIFSFRSAAIIGNIICFIGVLILSFASKNNLYFLYIGISLFLGGNTLCTPAIWSLVSSCYKKEDPRHDAGSSIFYIIFNIGAVISIIIISYLSTYYGFTTCFFYISYTFLFASLIGIFFPISDEKLISIKAFKSHFFILISAIIFSTICMLLLYYTRANISIMLFLATSTLLYLFINKKSFTPIESSKVNAFISLCFIGIFYLIVYNSELSVLPIFSEYGANLHVFSINFNPSIIISLDGFGVITIGLIFAWLWIYLGERNKNPSIITKFSIGIILAGVGFLILALIIFAYTGKKISFYWLILAFAFFTAAEMLVAPIGIAMVDTLSPKGYTGVCMGVWTLAAGSSAIIAGHISDLINIQPSMTEVGEFLRTVI